ncbi:undecaprenyl-diphosphatase [Desmospora profundinema]|uniref:Undecaprenyl-diphosphatase n=2 Tax=Desmospora profundinema TaxID=1571184 RepID=A0ABU1ISE0_9BACL|nr:undecaprenyl-diphosphatase [Desmospora profundinema]
MDYRLFEWINGWAGKYGWLDLLMIVMTDYGPYLFAILLGVLLLLKKHRSGGILAGCTLALALSFSFMIGQLWERARPFVTHDNVNLLLSKEPNASFPSDHTTGAFAIAFALCHYNKTLGNILLILALLIGISRPYVGHHYPGDVFAGMTVAFLAAQLVQYGMKRFRARSANVSETAS